LLRLRNIKDGIISLPWADDLLVAVAVEPETGYLPGTLALDGKGCIITNVVMGAGIAGILSAEEIAPLPLYQ
jgi:hypothetical protein